VTIVAKPLGSACRKSIGLVAGLSVPANPPTPKNRNLPFHGVGSRSSNLAEPSGAPKPVVFTVPSTSQNSGLALLAGTSTGATIVTLGTAKPASAAGLQLGNAAPAGAAPMSRPASTRPAACNGLFARMTIPPGIHPVRELSSKLRRRATVEVADQGRYGRRSS